MLGNLMISSDVSALLHEFISAWKLAHADALEETRWQRVKQVMADLAQAEPPTYEQWWQCLEQMSALLNCPQLGLEIGQHVKVEHFGCLGYLLKTSRDMEQALRSFERFQRLLYDGNRADLVFETTVPDRSTVKLVWSADYGHSHPLSDEVLIAGLLHLLQTLLVDTSISPLKIEFTHAVNADQLKAYEQFFHCPVLLNQPNLSVYFPAEYFSRTILGADEYLHGLINQQAESLLTQVPRVDAQGESFESQVRKHMVLALQQGNPSAETIAKAMHLSARSLHRRLNSEGLVYRELLKEVRMNLARRYLADHKMTLPETALMLGYSEQSAFTRAFKTWFGVTPTQHRRRAS